MPGNLGNAGAEGAFTLLVSRLIAAVPFPNCRRVIPSLCLAKFFRPNGRPIRLLLYSKWQHCSCLKIAAGSTLVARLAGTQLASRATAIKSTGTLKMSADHE